MALARGAADDAFNGALASLARLRQDELAALHEAQARLSCLLRRGCASCQQGHDAPEFSAWGEDAAAELASLAIGECGSQARVAGPAEAVPAALRKAESPSIAARPESASPPLPEAPQPPLAAPGAVHTEPPLLDLAAAEDLAAAKAGALPPPAAPQPPRAAPRAVHPEPPLLDPVAAEDPAAAKADAPPPQETRLSWGSGEEADAQSTKNPAWEWEHRTGFRRYAEAASVQIEDAWRRGEPKVRLRAGKTGKTPMEIFFADMAQLDPTTGSSRNVRRVGGESYLGWLERNFNLVWKKFLRRRMHSETSQEYRKRQLIKKQYLPDTELVLLTGHIDRSQMFSSTPHEFDVRGRRAQVGLRCGILLRNFWWNVLTWVVTAINVFWIYWMTEHYPGTLSFGRPAGVLATDISFLVFFSADLMIRLLARKDATYALHCKMFLRDAWVVAAKLFDVLLFPLLYSVGGTRASSGSSFWDVDPDTSWFWLALIVRLSRLLRVERLFRIFPQASTIGRAMVSGLESAGVILLMMAGACFGFVVLLKTGVRDADVAEMYFLTVADTFQTLIVQGLFFDGVLDYLEACGDENLGYFGMLLWVCVGQYCFLNMLIGVFSSVAAGATSEQADRQETAHLERNLASILECYLDEAPWIPSGSNASDPAQLDRDHFNLILQNLDVLDVLEACGTDVEGLQAMKNVLFPRETSRLSFQDLYEVLLRLRKGKPASVADVVNLRELTRQRTHELQELLEGRLC